MLCATFLLAQPGLSADTDDADAHELILLFDLSTSMSWNDTEFLAPDALQQIVSSLPSYWHLGIVTFRADVIDAVAPGADTRGMVGAILGEARYSNYTNSGAGLVQAMDLFSDNARSRTIVFMTDGEMAMLPSADATAEAVTLAEQAIAQVIESDIQVHTIAVGIDFDRTHEAILGLAPATGGTLFQDVRSAELSKIASTLVFDVLGVARSQAGAAQLDDTTGTFAVRLPATGLDFARVLITAESALDHIVVSSSGANVGIQTGQRFALVEITRPLDPVITIELSAEGMSSVSLILEWDLRLMTAIADDGIARLWLLDSMGENVLRNPFFSQQAYNMEAEFFNLDAHTGEVLDATRAHLEVFGVNTRQEIAMPEIETFANFPTSPSEEISETSENAEEVVEVPVEGTFLVERDPWFTLFPFALTAFVFSLLVLICLLVLHFRRRRAVSPSVAALPRIVTPVTQSADSRFAFAGKLDLYLYSTLGGRESAPKTVHMFSFGKKGADLPLEMILRKCGIADAFPGSDQIYFSANGQGSLQVAVDSNGIAFVGTKPLEERQGHALSNGESVRVPNRDQTQELEVSPRFLYRT